MWAVAVAVGGVLMNGAVELSPVGPLAAVRIATATTGGQPAAAGVLAVAGNSCVGRGCEGGVEVALGMGGRSLSACPPKMTHAGAATPNADAESSPGRGTAVPTATTGGQAPAVAAVGQPVAVGGLAATGGGAHVVVQR